jgi:hypothetical protein
MDFQVTGDVDQVVLVTNSMRNLETTYRQVLIAQSAQELPDDALFETGKTFGERKAELSRQHAKLLKDNKPLVKDIQRFAKHTAPALPPTEEPSEPS